MISVIIPARNERFLTETIEDIYRNFTGEFEVIVMLDGPHDGLLPALRENMVVLGCAEPKGIRPTLNFAVSQSKGDVLLKVDAHCAFCKGFDEIMLEEFQPDWVKVARRYTLDLPTWKPTPRAVDYYYLSCPWTHPKGMMMQSCPWIRRTEAWPDIRIDDLMCFQGSLWMMSREHWDWLGGLAVGEETYAEHHEISMKTWLAGKRVVTDKRAWYAHPAQRASGYRMDMQQVYRDHDHSARYWTAQPGFQALIEKFWPLPMEHTRHRAEKYYWPEDWKKYYDGTM